MLLTILGRLNLYCFRIQSKKAERNKERSKQRLEQKYTQETADAIQAMKIDVLEVKMSSTGWSGAHADRNVKKWITDRLRSNNPMLVRQLVEKLREFQQIPFGTGQR